MSKVYLFECKKYNESKEVMDKIITSFNVLKNIKKGTKVVIKANLVSALDPNKAATTHPILLKHLVTYLSDKGCEVVIGDSPGGVYTKTYLNHIYKVTKMDETGALLNDDFSIKATINDEAKVLKNFQYTAYLDKADIIINFSKLKTHAMMGMSASVKNLFGTIPGTMKPEYHYRFPKHEDFANMLIDLNEYFKCDINIVDAITGMEGNGPTMGTPRDIGLVLASENPYELDFVCSKIINLNINDIETLKQAKERCLLKEENIETNIDYQKYIISDYKVNKKLNSILFFNNSNNIFSKFISYCSNKIFANKPQVKKNKCIGCQKCANICPAKAIHMENKIPVIDRSKCIKCYCCQEFCPMGAMQVKKSWIVRLLNIKR